MLSDIQTIPISNMQLLVLLAITKSVVGGEWQRLRCKSKICPFFFLAKDPAALATLWQHKYFLAEHLKNCGSLFAFDNCIQPAVKILSTSGLVAMTSALHAEGRQFDPGLV